MNELEKNENVEGDIILANEFDQAAELAKFDAVFKSVNKNAWELAKLASDAIKTRNAIEISMESGTCKYSPANILTIKDLAALYGWSQSQFSKSARVYDEFKNDTFCLPFSFYSEVLPIINSHSLAVAEKLLKDAQLGERFEGDHSEYGYKRPWTKKDLRRAVSITLGKLSQTAPVPDSLEEQKDKSLKVVDKALQSIPKAKREPIKNSIERGVKIAYKELQDGYTDSVAKEVRAQVRTIRNDLQDELVADRAKLKDRLKYVDEMRQEIFDSEKPINCLMTQIEYKKLLSFCHPDKNIGNEEKAKEVTLIVQKLGKSFQPKFLRKVDLEMQGWKK